MKQLFDSLEEHLGSSGPQGASPDASSKLDTSSEEYIRDGEFGIGRWRPRSLQFMATLWAFVGLYSPCALWLVTIVQFTRTQITSIERHFKINSGQSGVLMSSIDVGSICFVLVGSHFGKFYHIPRLLALSAMVAGLAVASVSLVQVATPRSLVESGRIVERERDIGNEGSTNRLKYLCWNVTEAPTGSFSNSSSNLTLGASAQGKSFHASLDHLEDDGEESLPWTYFLMMFFMFIAGAVMSYKIPLQTYYVESNVKEKRQSGLFVGVMVAAMVFGSPVALFLGGLINKMPVDLGNTDMRTSDQRWISAWWMGYIIIGVCSIVSSIPVLCLPRHIIHKDKDKEESPASSIDFFPKADMDDVQMYLLEKAVITNETVIYEQPINTSATKDTMGSDSMENYIRDNGASTSNRDTRPLFSRRGVPNYRTLPNTEPTPELVDKLKDWPHSLKRVLSNPVVVLVLMDSLVTFTGLLGTMAFQLKYFEKEFDKPGSTVSFALGIGQICTAVTGTFLGGYAVTRFRLSRAAMFKTAFVSQFTALCLSVSFVFLGCDNHHIEGMERTGRNLSWEGCTCSDRVLFVCGSDQVNYISPCWAGCGEVEGLNFQECSKISEGGTAEPGFCDNGCSTFLPVLLIYVSLVFVATLGLTPRTLMIVRTVLPQDQSMVTGLMNGFITRLAAIIGPIVFGQLFDSTCILWPSDGGSCLLSDKDDLRYTFLGTGAIIRAFGVLFLMLATILVHREDRDRMDDQEMLDIPTHHDHPGTPNDNVGVNELAKVACTSDRDF